MSCETVGQLFRIDRTARASLNMMGDKGEFTETTYSEKFAKVRDAVLEENGLEGAEIFWSLPENTPIGPRASALVGELLYWLTKVRDS